MVDGTLVADDHNHCHGTCWRIHRPHSARSRRGRCLRPILELNSLDRGLGGAVALLAIIAVSTAMLGWKHGLDEMWVVLILIATASILYRGEPDDEPRFTNGIALMSLPLLIAISTNEPARILEATDSLPELDISLIAVASTGAVMAIYLPRAGKDGEIAQAGGGSTLVAGNHHRALSAIEQRNSNHGRTRPFRTQFAMVGRTRRDSR